MIKKYKTSHGYIRIMCPQHPFCDNSGYIYEHRFELENYLGRFLLEEELVHHINGIRDDNRIENLFLCADDEEHSKIHYGWQKINGQWFKPCGSCKKLLKVDEDNFYFRKTGYKKGKPVCSCKKCTSAMSKKYREKNAEKIRKMMKLYRDKNSEEINRKVKQWREDNPEKYKKAIREYRERNPNAAKNSSKKWRESNPEKVKEYLAKTREKRRQYSKEYYWKNKDKFAEKNRQRAREYYRKKKEFSNEEKQNANCLPKVWEKF